MVDTVLAARGTFEMTLIFHIVFASLGVVMSFMILVSQWLYLRRGNPVYKAINKKWTTAFALTYAVGAVSGTVLTIRTRMAPDLQDLRSHTNPRAFGEQTKRSVQTGLRSRSSSLLWNRGSRE